MKRGKLYYPKSAITENLYTSGGEYMFETGLVYIGYYHKYDTGEVYTRPSWDPTNSLKLLPYTDVSNISKKYFKDGRELIALLKSDANTKKYSHPITNITNPSQDEYLRGYFYRYFSVKRNDPVIINEINKNDYFNAGNTGGLNSFLYKTGQIKWHLIGDEYDTIDANGRIIKRGVIDNNKREVFALTQRYPYIYTIFGDYRKFTPYSRANDYLYRE